VDEVNPKNRLFPPEFLARDGCFGLFRPGAETGPDRPVSMEADAGLPVHIVHSDPRQLAYIVGLIALQAWTCGIDETCGAVEERHPILVITEKPGLFAESYLQLRLPPEQIPELFRRHRVSVGTRGGCISGASSYLDHKLGQEDQRTRLHNFFPAAQIAGAESTPRMIEDREFVGRGDEDRPAVLITRRSDTATLDVIRRRFDPILVMVDDATVAGRISIRWDRPSGRSKRPGADRAYGPLWGTGNNPASHITGLHAAISYGHQSGHRRRSRPAGGTRKRADGCTTMLLIANAPVFSRGSGTG